MTGPTQNLGSMAQAQKLAGAMVDTVAMILPKVGASTPFGQDLVKIMQLLGKHAQAGAPPSDGLRNLAMKQQQNQPHAAALQASAPGGGAPGGMPPGGAPKPPMTPPAA
jgi:hypothetical protein